jgi:hypothetical protein
MFVNVMQFGDLEGTPVTLTPDLECKAWDVPGGRPLPVASFVRATVLSEEEFRDRVSTMWDDLARLGFRRH